MPKVDHCKQLTVILNSVADGVFTVDDRMRITLFNKAAEEITGFTEEEAMGRHCHDIFRTDVCFTSCPVKEALESGQPVINREVDIITKEGKKVPISISASVLKDENGKPLGGVETFRDQSLIYALKKEIEEKYTFHDLVSRNPAMRRLFDVLPDIASSEATVLLKGESGTGKELFAQAIHDLSPRRKGPLVIVNCGALPEPLLEAEIFGARRGAYTGSIENRPGRLEMAEGGTLFLDEIGDLPLPLQVKLLRVLENHEYQPLGARSPQKADVRFLTATNCDLEDMVEKGTFRRDLFFRINVVALQIPPLRERPEDVPLLIDVFLDRFNRTYGKKIRGFSGEALQLLLSHSYPGNVRELLNLVEQTVILCRSGEIGVEHLPAGFLEASDRDEDVSFGRRSRINKAILQDLLARYEGNRTKVAKELGVDRTTLWRWMKKFDLSN
ncbi:sigma 54-interacting transcriptional regulator [Desulfuromonas sp. KJ2020]|uniref:sigma-54 interaction domain-containing protein n=1 Tax=Desulfuromonas sp. KJ2020 TaxID=2919173 RepID=UPI000322C6C2|nr:sigma 54-interacting transcriptional regulator [Desulfuromonas sp. KJ2020]MCP3176280.1 sigma 54-interacting transcriptional regulator [Desulfuromonas sp. KJ2020]